MNTINHEDFQAVFVNTTQIPLSIDIECYFVKSANAGEIALYRVVTEKYPHPDAPDHANISVTKIEHVRTFKRTELRGGVQCVLQENAQNNLEEILRILKIK